MGIQRLSIGRGAPARPSRRKLDSLCPRVNAVKCMHLKVFMLTSVHENYITFVGGGEQSEVSFSGSSFSHPSGEEEDREVTRPGGAPAGAAPGDGSTGG